MSLDNPPRCYGCGDPLRPLDNWKTKICRACIRAKDRGEEVGPPFGMEIAPREEEETNDE